MSLHDAKKIDYLNITEHSVNISALLKEAS